MPTPEFPKLMPHLVRWPAFVACWGDAFGHFGLELLAAAAGDVFGNSPESRDFSQHDWWAPFTRLPVTAELAWRTGYADSDAPRP